VATLNSPCHETREAVSIAKREPEEVTRFRHASRRPGDSQRIICRTKFDMAMVKNALLVVAGLVSGLLLVESVLRLAGWSFPVFGRPDTELGWSFRPGVSGWVTQENPAYVRMNRFGFRGPEWLEQPTPDVFRIVVIGDSFVESSNLSDKHAFTSMIEKHLVACPAFSSGRIEVLNLGVSGYGTAQEYLLLQQRVESFRPNSVLLAFYVGNDVSDNSYALSRSEESRAQGVNAERPYFVQQESGELLLDTSFRDTDHFQQLVRTDWLRRLVNASYLLQVVKQLYTGRSILASSVESRDANGDIIEHQTIVAPVFAQLFSPPTDETWRSAWAVTEELLLRIRDWTQRRSIDFKLVLLPAPIQALPGEDMRQVAVRAFGLANLDYPIQRISHFAAQNAIPYLSLLDPFRVYADQERSFLYGFPPQLGHGHLNATGSELSGRSIGNWLCQSHPQHN
jgi:hypothetical protein